KCFITFLCCKVLQRSLCFISCSVNSLCRLFFAVFFLQHFLENAECDSRLCCSSGFGNNIYGEISVSDHVNKMFQVGTAYAVSCIVNLRCLTDFLWNHVVEIVAQKFNCCPCSQVGSADSDHDQHFGICLYFLCCFLDA